jgi:predicted P-loop ATPase/GTPase
MIPSETLTQVRRGHKYSEHQLNLYSAHKTSSYTLYLALSNYAEILEALRESILESARNYIAGVNNTVAGHGNIVLGSNNRLAGTDNWVLTSK